MRHLIGFTLVIIAALLFILTLTIGVVTARVKAQTSAEHRKWVCIIRHTFTDDQCDFIANELWDAMNNE